MWRPAGGSFSVIPGPNILYWSGRTLYVNLTSRCSAACGFCLRSFTWEVFGYDLRLEADQEPSAADLTAALAAETAASKPEEVVFVGLGEPTYALDVLLEGIAFANGQGLPTRLDTNGHGRLLNPGRDVVAELALAGLDKVSVSLNSHDEATYEELCKPAVVGAFRAVCSFIRRCADAGIEVTASVVDVPEVDKAAAERLARDLGATAFRVRRLIRAVTTGAVHCDEEM